CVPWCLLVRNRRLAPDVAALHAGVDRYGVAIALKRQSFGIRGVAIRARQRGQLHRGHGVWTSRDWLEENGLQSSERVGVRSPVKSDRELSRIPSTPEGIP